jgi:hypothetical protein
VEATFDEYLGASREVRALQQKEALLDGGRLHRADLLRVTIHGRERPEQGHDA